MESILAIKKDLSVPARDIPFKVPADLAEFLEGDGGVRGIIGANHVDLYSVAEILEFNESYAVSEFLPDHLLIGTINDEALVIDANAVYYVVPFVGMFVENCVKVAENLEDLLEKCKEDFL